MAVSVSIVEYTVNLEVLHELSPEEIDQSFRDCEARFRQLLRRYLPEWSKVHTENLNELHLDFVRSSWLNDPRKSRMSKPRANTAFGFAFGTFLCKIHKMRWCTTRDAWGDTLSVVFISDGLCEDQPKLVAVDPFNYVKKRQTVRNFEVFTDGSRAIKLQIHSQGKSGHPSNE